MSQSGIIAISVLIATMLVSLRTPGKTRSWAERARFTRSSLIVTLCALNCFFDDIAPSGSLSDLTYVNLIVAANLVVAQLQSFDSVWTGRRIRPVTRLTATLAAALTAWQGQTSPLIIVGLTILAGISHARLTRLETVEIIKNFRLLQDRMASHDAANRGIAAGAGHVQTEARDKTREAG